MASETIFCAVERLLPSTTLKALPLPRSSRKPMSERPSLRVAMSLMPMETSPPMSTRLASWNFAPPPVTEKARAPCCSMALRASDALVERVSSTSRKSVLTFRVRPVPVATTPLMVPPTSWPTSRNSLASWAKVWLTVVWIPEVLVLSASNS